MGCSERSIQRRRDLGQGVVKEALRIWFEAGASLVWPAPSAGSGQLLAYAMNVASKISRDGTAARLNRNSKRLVCSNLPMTF